MRHTTSPVIVLIAVSAVTACQTCPEPAYGPDEVLTEDVEASVYPPILVSRDDVLTPQTKAAIRGHNNTVWCRNPDERPAGFPVDEVC